MPLGPLDDKKRWQERIQLSFDAKKKEDEYAGLASRRLLLLKEAIGEVALRMADEKTIDVAQEMEDKIGWTMTCIRAIEKANLNTVRKCVLAYHKIADIISPLGPYTRSLPSFVALEDHAVEFSRRTIMAELSSLQASGDNLDLQVKT